MRPCVATILVVDDDMGCTRAYEREARRLGKRLFAAASCTNARRIAEEERLDLAIVDLRLGCESGIDVIAALRSRHPTLAIALVSGYLSIAFAVVALRAGADTIIFKPVRIEEIIRHLDGELAASEPSWDETPTLARAEWEHISRVLADCHGNVSEAARRLGIYRQSLQRKLRKHAPHV